MNKTTLRSHLLIWGLSLVLSSMLSFGAFAQEGSPIDSHTYSPDYCEFTVTFPSEPYKSRRCESQLGDRCYDLISYTQVYELASTVNFRIICNPIDESVYNEYSPEVMEATLRAMTKSSVVEEFDSSFREADGYKQAGLVGEGQVGRTPTIYLAQLWIGKKSVLSVEAELIGEAMEKADTLFSDILRSVRYKDPQHESSEEADDDKQENQNDTQATSEDAKN